MQSYRKVGVVVVFVCFILVTVAAMTVLSNYEQGSRQRANEPKRTEYLDKLPVFDADTPEPSDPEKRAKRLAKNKTYSDPYLQEKDRLSTVGIGAIHNEWDLGLESALPVAQSSAVVAGDVIDAKAYLSEDKNNVYSEYTVLVEEVIKDDSREPIAAGASIATDRLGGSVRFPSGRVASLFVPGQGVPEVGKRFVFFLGFNRREAGNRAVAGPREMNRHLLTAYELREGKVFPLDYTGGRNFDNYKGRGETAFLNEIRSSVASSSQASPR